jgi:hypothetical protein
MARKAGFGAQAGQFYEFCGENQAVLGWGTVLFVLLTCQKLAKTNQKMYSSGKG